MIINGKSIISLRLIVIAVIALLILGSALPAWFAGQCQITFFSQYGDWLAGLSSMLLQGLAVVLLFLTYRAQREELEQTRKVFEVDQLNNFYFELLRQYFDATHRVIHTERSHSPAAMIFNNAVPADKHSRIALSQYYENLVQLYSGSQSINSVAAYFTEHEPELGEWRRSINAICSLVNSSTVKTKDKKRLLKSFRQYMSVNETRLLALDVMTRDSGDHGTAALLIENNFFKYGKLQSTDWFERFDALSLKRHQLHLVKPVGEPLRP